MPTPQRPRYTENTTVMLDPATRERIDQMGQVAGVSLSEVLRAMIKVAMRSPEKIKELLEP